MSVFYEEVKRAVLPWLLKSVLPPFLLSKIFLPLDFLLHQMVSQSDSVVSISTKSRDLAADINRSR